MRVDVQLIIGHFGFAINNCIGKPASEVNKQISKTDNCCLNIERLLILGDCA